MPDRKVTPELETRIQSSDPGQLLDVVIELKREPEAASAAIRQPATRSAAIAERRAAFERRAAPVAATVEAEGGEVRDTAWINSTMRVRIAPDRLRKLEALEAVDHIDVPHAITPDQGGRP